MSTQRDIESDTVRARMDDLGLGGFELVVYGSRAYKHPSTTSDLDILLIRTSTGTDETIRGREFEIVTQIEAILGVSDAERQDEVPLKRKLTASWTDLLEAAGSSHFICDGAASVDRIVKTPSFLASRKMVLRLWQNCLLSPVIYYGRDPARFEALAEIARSAIWQIFIEVENLQFHSTRKDADAVQKFAKWAVGEGDSDYWLGFRDHPSVMNHLKKCFITESDQ
jgi:predicted nucleotidyltransferase